MLTNYYIVVQRYLNEIQLERLVHLNTNAVIFTMRTHRDVMLACKGNKAGR